MKKFFMIFGIVVILVLFSAIGLACDKTPKADNDTDSPNNEDITPFASITFFYDGADSGVSATQKNVEVGSQIGQLPSPSKTGYTFLGWFNADLGGKVSETTIIEKNEYYTLLASFSANTYLLTFDYNGADPDELELTRSITFHQPIGKLPSPKKDGFFFGGWYLIPSGSGASLSDNHIWTIASDTTLYAVWNLNAVDASESFMLEETEDKSGIIIAGLSNKGFLETKITVPKSLKGKPVVKVLSKAFALSNMTEFVLEAVDAEIEYGILSGCTLLTSMTVPLKPEISYQTNSYLRYYFASSAPISTLPTSSSSSYALPSSLKSVTIIGTTKLANYAFNYAHNLTSITLPDNLESIGDYAFRECIQLASISLPNTVTTIGTYAFYNCESLASISLPQNLTSIGNYAFRYCTSLNNLVLPALVTSIGSYAFGNCSSLLSITVNALVPPSIANYALYGVPTNVKIYVPQDSLAAYSTASYWSAYKGKMEGIDS